MHLFICIMISVLLFSWLKSNSGKNDPFNAEDELNVFVKVYIFFFSAPEDIMSKEKVEYHKW